MVQAPSSWSKTKCLVRTISSAVIGTWGRSGSPGSMVASPCGPPGIDPSATGRDDRLPLAGCDDELHQGRTGYSEVVQIVRSGPILLLEDVLEEHLVECVGEGDDYVGSLSHPQQNVGPKSRPFGAGLTTTLARNSPDGGIQFLRLVIHDVDAGVFDGALRQSKRPWISLPPC